MAVSPLYKEDPTFTGSNHPPVDKPLAEMLVDETGDVKKRAEDLAGAVGRAVITDDETAGKATLLASMIKKHVDLIDETRETRKRPFLEAGRTVDAHFSAIAGIVATFDGKRKLIGGPLSTLMGKIDTHRREQEAKAEAERRRLAEEARKQREAAELAERQRLAAEAETRRIQEDAERRIREAEEAAQRSNDLAAQAEARRQRAAADAQREKDEAAARERQMQAELDQRRAAEAAADLERQAAATKAGPIDSGYGAKASGRKVFTAEIIDLTAAIRHCRKVDEATLKAAVQQIYDRQVKAGVRELPGATVTESSATVIR